MFTQRSVMNALLCAIVLVASPLVGQILNSSSLPQSPKPTTTQSAPASTGRQRSSVFQHCSYTDVHTVYCQSVRFQWIRHALRQHQRGYDRVERHAEGFRGGGA